MKTKLILGSLLALVTIANSQIYTPSGVITGASINNNVGIGTANPATKLELFSSAPNLILLRLRNNNWACNQTTELEFWNGSNKNHPTSKIISKMDGCGANGEALVFETQTAGQTVTSQKMVIKNNGDVGIGTTAPNAKLEVLASVNPIAHQWGIKSGINTNGPAFSYMNYTGVEGVATSYANGESRMIGVVGDAYNGQYNTGGKFYAAGGVAGGGGLKNIGVYAEAYGNTNAYGIYATASGGNTNYAGFFDGNTNTMGGVYSTYVLLTSDKKLKKNIQPLTSGLEKIRLLKPSTYTFKTEEFTGMNLPTEKQLGLIAQELEEVFPELVSEIASVDKIDKDGKVTSSIPEHKAVNYIGLIPVLISAIQDQDKTILAQQQQMDELKQLLVESLKNQATGINSIHDFETGFQMSQNEPNPFTHETVVKYTLSQTISNAFMAVYDLTGKQITTFPINEKGSSSITITSEKLAAGIYIYSIVADGKVLDSKRMIVAEK